MNVIMESIACFDIGGTFIKYGFIDNEGKFLIKGELQTPKEKCGELIPMMIVNKINEFNNKFYIKSVGISTAGQVDSKKGEIIFASENLPDYTGAKIAQYIYDNTGLQCTVENDVNAAAMGELCKGAARGVDTFVCITLGTGIGGAIVINGKVHKGVGGAAGELGHMIINEGGEQCTCGLKGCYERYGSTSALIRNYKKELEAKGIEVEDMKDIDGKSIMGKVLSGDETAVKVYDKFLDNIVTGLVGITHILDPGLIVVGGGISSQGDVFFNEINKRFKKKVMTFYGKYTEIVQAKLNNDAGLFGAYYLAMENSFNKK
jgi:glucokinase